MIIVGAGLAGLIAGNLIPKSEVHEALPSPQKHRAVLRFRSPAVGDAMGIAFREVTVRKGIWMEEGFCNPDILLANWYSKKVTGSIMDRSIWKLEPEQRWIAPEDFSDRLVDQLGDRVKFNTRHQFDIFGKNQNIISTAPMPVMERLFIGGDQYFGSAPIHVVRYRIDACDVHQTIYFPDPNLKVYRASITGDLLAIESMSVPGADEVMQVFEAFGLELQDHLFVDSGEQKYGKLLPINEAFRRDFIRTLSSQFGIYSLGRFATWRSNLLLDEVLKDVAVIKKLSASDNYGSALHFTRTGE